MRNFGLALLAMLFAASSSLASQLEWGDLIDPEAQTFEDPYRDLKYDQIDAVARIARLNAKIEDVGLSDDARDEAMARVEDLKADLAEQGIDADWLISQRWEIAARREHAAISGNPAVDGVEVTMGGFAIPAPPDEDGTPTAYLVPERGMCSHMPPPPPNQMIRMRMRPDWVPRMVHEPVKVSGRLAITPTQREVVVVDGVVQMHATFELEVADVKTLRFSPVAAGQSGEVAKSFSDNNQEQLQAAEGESPSED